MRLELDFIVCEETSDEVEYKTELRPISSELGGVTAALGDEFVYASCELHSARDFHATNDPRSHLCLLLANGGSPREVGARLDLALAPEADSDATQEDTSEIESRLWDAWLVEKHALVSHHTFELHWARYLQCRDQLAQLGEGETTERVEVLSQMGAALRHVRPSLRARALATLREMSALRSFPDAPRSSRDANNIELALPWTTSPTIQLTHETQVPTGTSVLELVGLRSLVRRITIVSRARDDEPLRFARANTRINLRTVPRYAGCLWLWNMQTRDALLESTLAELARLMPANSIFREWQGFTGWSRRRLLDEVEELENDRALLEPLPAGPASFFAIRMPGPPWSEWPRFRADSANDGAHAAIALALMGRVSLGTVLDPWPVARLLTLFDLVERAGGQLPRVLADLSASSARSRLPFPWP